MTPAALLGALFLKPALVIGAAAAITACLGRHAAAVRHAVWTAAILLIVALPILSLTLPPLRIPAPLDALQSLPWPGLRGSTPSADANAGAAPAVGKASPRGGTPRWDFLSGRGTVDRLPEAIVGIWILGVLAFGTRRVIVEGRLRQIVRRARPVSNPGLERLLAGVVRSSGVPRRVELRLSDEIGTPAVAGVFRSVILLPTSVDTWAEADVAAALRHELAHVARHDCILNRIADLATAIYWCNPIVRVAVRRMRKESERACDDCVLQGGCEPEEYARLLLAVARTAQAHGALPEATSMARAGELEARLLAVLDQGVRRAPPPRWLSAGLVCLGIALALPTAALTLVAAPFTSADLVAPEPDRLEDSLSKPASERVTLPPEAYRLSRGAVDALAGPDSALASRLVEALGHEPDSEADLVRERAAWALSQARDGRLVEPLLRALQASDWRVSAYAAWALATARDPRAVPGLVSLLRHPVWRLRAMAAYALRESGDPRAEAAMSDALNDPAWQVRLEAVQYVSALGGPMRLRNLRPRLGDRHLAVRLAAEQALASL